LPKSSSVSRAFELIRSWTTFPRRCRSIRRCSSSAYLFNSSRYNNGAAVGVRRDLGLAPVLGRWRMASPSSRSGGRLSLVVVELHQRLDPSATALRGSRKSWSTGWRLERAARHAQNRVRSLSRLCRDARQGRYMPYVARTLAMFGAFTEQRVPVGTGKSEQRGRRANAQDAVR
jgi:hypothetical protein